jgi:hypothetical protein
MTYNVFGYSYPPGAANDPYAPYNQKDLPEDCPVCGGPNSDDDGIPLYEKDHSFCSEKCAKQYDSEQVDMYYYEVNNP